MREANMWFLHTTAGLVIFVLLALHMAIMHLDDLLLFLGTGYSNPLAFESVVERSRQLFYLVTYILLLGAALYHGLYGFRTILFELTLGEGTERSITVVFTVVGLGLFVFGTYAAVTVYTMPN
jgi:succinate dehydrogenase / fumarate reductase membrane anchor subunit